MRGTFNFESEELPEHFRMNLTIPEEYREESARRSWFIIRTAKNPQLALMKYEIGLHNEYEAYKKKLNETDPAYVKEKYARAAKRRKRTIEKKLADCDLEAYFDSKNLTNAQAVRKCREFIRDHAKSVGAKKNK